MKNTTWPHLHVESRKIEPLGNKMFVNEYTFSVREAG